MTTFNTEYEVYFEDISPSGIVHLEKLAEWMSMGREKYFRKTCPDHLKFVDGEVNMFTVVMSILIMGRSKWADKINVVITTAKIKRISFEMHFDFQNKRTNEIIAQGIQKVAFIKNDAENFAPIPNDMKNVIVNYVK